MNGTGSQSDFIKFTVIKESHSATMVNVINKYPYTCHCEGDSPKQSLRFGLLHFVRNDNFLFLLAINALMWGTSASKI